MLNWLYWCVILDELNNPVLSELICLGYFVLSPFFGAVFSGPFLGAILSGLFFRSCFVLLGLLCRGNLVLGCFDGSRFKEYFKVFFF